MIIAHTMELVRLAKLANKTVNKTESIILDFLIKKEMIDDSDTDNFGEIVGDCIPEYTFVSDLCEVFSDLGIEKITSNRFDDLLNLKLMGEGDCPFCGGDLIPTGLGSEELRCNVCKELINEEE